MKFVKQNITPVEIETVSDEHLESRDFMPSFWWGNKRYYLDEFLRVHNNPYLGCTDFPEYIDGMEQGVYYKPLFIEIVSAGYLNIYLECEE